MDRELVEAYRDLLQTDLSPPHAVIWRKDSPVNRENFRGGWEFQGAQGAWCKEGLGRYDGATDTREQTRWHRKRN